MFLTGNDIPARLRDGFQVAELGFGTGLNALALCAAVDAAGMDGTVGFTSFEAFPMAAPDMDRALACFPDVAPYAEQLVTHWSAGQTEFAIAGVRIEVILGDARETLPRWTGMADAWFLDGFAPAKNAALWEDGLLQQVANHTAPGGSAATYTAAGHVRRSLATAGFDVDRIPGYGRKRHMTVARKPR